ncbi:MAG: non-ribosomal peptide synthetase, partial [Tumebacillaceae bacterium]
VANVKLYVLDSHMHPVPIGVPGELYIGGQSVGLGYLNRPELTAERFIVNPFTGLTTDRLYKTGDLVRYLPDGNLEFIGRMDNQVKINGVRMELGEIEAVLAQHPAVKSCAVLLREDVPGSKRLVAYVVAATAVTGSDLRAAMKELLPENMIPSAFVLLEEFPLTPSGKVDRRALPMPTDTLTAMEQRYVAPRNTTEEVLVLIWKELLGLEKVGVETNFFEVGGNSLTAMSMISKVRETFAVNVPTQKMFSLTTISGMAAALFEHETKPGQVEAVARVRKKVMEMTPEQRQALLEAKKGERG